MKISALTMAGAVIADRFYHPYKSIHRGYPWAQVEEEIAREKVQAGYGLSRAKGSTVLAASLDPTF
ncbi:unnamed protein product [Acanthoscelides obtectus]|uniref:Uncharacterized protein n=1 Tax=Acanthoscelides obtectus TaxID=200917 RepID=A0A9P0Q5X9_ACAOB|nr:unnamed protein product [Acanthoscelides obtectus]CAK1682283.1 hypothetical protein AOBTE_LOCUS33532 [Acanthoscelides obtectus]